MLIENYSNQCPLGDKYFKVKYNSFVTTDSYIEGTGMGYQIKKNGAKVTPCSS